MDGDLQRHSVAEAAELAREPGTATRARAIVDERFTLERMERTLAGVYRFAAATGALPYPVEGFRAA